MDRRRFLKLLGLTVGGAAALPAVAKLPIDDAARFPTGEVDHASAAMKEFNKQVVADVLKIPRVGDTIVVDGEAFIVTETTMSCGRDEVVSLDATATHIEGRGEAMLSYVEGNGGFILASEEMYLNDKIGV